MKFSIVIPSYNQAEFLGPCIESVIEQSSPDYEIEIILIDGGSTDGTVDVIRKYADNLAYWVSESDNGQSHALNKGFEKSTGDMLAWLCSDDYYLPGAIQKVFNSLSNAGDANFIYGNGYKVDRTGGIISEINCDPLDHKNLENYNYIFSTSAFWTAELWHKAGEFIDESNHWTMDWELFLRMRPYAKYRHLNTRLACLRTYPETKTASGMSATGSKRDLEIARVSRRHAGAFCYNSIIYALRGPVRFVENKPGIPRIIKSTVFRFSYLLQRLLPVRKTMLLG
jgi:glycosyltransferase involved in cell wall biosynthesis